jgi:hypothetical protein
MNRRSRRAGGFDVCWGQLQSGAAEEQTAVQG